MWQHIPCDEHARMHTLPWLRVRPKVRHLSTRLHARRGTLAKSSKRRHVVNVGVCNVHFYHLLPYATLVWVGKSAFIAFIIVCVQAPADGKGGAPVVRSVL